MALKKQSGFQGLVSCIYQTHSVLQQNARQAINQNLTIRNWLIGCYIVEFEQNGEDRAKYGVRLLTEMAKTLKAKRLKGLDLRTLRSCRTFYIVYPQMLQSVTATLHKELPAPIRGSLTPEFEKNAMMPIRGSLTPELLEEHPIPPETLLSRLSFTHFVELIRKDDPLERLFYEVETIKNNWSVRELERAINTALYVRTGLSKNKEAVVRKFKNQKPADTEDIICEPYSLEFLGLAELPSYSESDLEQAILNHLQHFLMELGTGFCFETRQKRITFDNTHHRIDLVFYHRILKCHVLIDLKIGKFDHADAGQMNVYLNYYKDNELAEGDNPPVGLILCGDKNETLAKYAVIGIDNRLFVSKYLVNLPDKQLLETFIKRELAK